MMTIVVLVALFVAVTPGDISTLAGTGRSGNSGDLGSATEARLNSPFDVAYDRGGNLYFSVTMNHKIRRVATGTGIISTVAGNGSKGFSGDGGPATSATLDEPYGLAIDAEGSIYFADRLNRRVRKVDGRTGTISTVAGGARGGYSGDGGRASSAGLVEPNGVALDGKGRLFIADVADHRIRVVDLGSGLIATFAGNGQGKRSGDGGPASNCSLFGARAVEVGGDGTVYILERQGHSLRAVDPKSGLIRTVAGTGKKGYSGDGGPALAATFDGPKELAVDSQGHCFVVDTENHVIRRIVAKTGLITTVAGDGRSGGTGDGGPAVSARLDRPHGVAVAPTGSLVIGDTGNHRLRSVAATGKD